MKGESPSLSCVGTHAHVHTHSLSVSHSHVHTHSTHIHTRITHVPTGGSESAREARKREISPFFGRGDRGGSESSSNHQQDKQEQVCLYVYIHFADVALSDFDEFDLLVNHATCMRKSFHTYE